MTRAIIAASALKAKAVLLVNGRQGEGVESFGQSRNVADHASAEPWGVDRSVDRAGG